MSPYSSILAILLGIGSTGASALGQCGSWDNRLTAAGGPDGAVMALTSWDPDGSGPTNPQLVAGGSFTTAAGVVVNHVARWDGTAWRPFGAGMNGPVRSLATWDPDGTGPEPVHLVAGGEFTTSGGLTTNHIAHWNGAAWQIFSSGFNSDCYALTLWDQDGPLNPLPPEITTAGDFSMNPSASTVARWHSPQWWPLAGPFGGLHQIYALSTWDNDALIGTPARLVAGATSPTTVRTRPATSQCTGHRGGNQSDSSVKGQTDRSGRSPPGAIPMTIPEHRHDWLSGVTSPSRAVSSLSTM